MWGIRIPLPSLLPLLCIQRILAERDFWETSGVGLSQSLAESLAWQRRRVGEQGCGYMRTNDMLLGIKLCDKLCKLLFLPTWQIQSLRSVKVAKYFLSQILPFPFFALNTVCSSGGFETPDKWIKTLILLSRGMNHMREMIHNKEFIYLYSLPSPKFNKIIRILISFNLQKKKCFPEFRDLQRPATSVSAGPVPTCFPQSAPGPAQRIITSLHTAWFFSTIWKLNWSRRINESCFTQIRRW